MDGMSESGRGEYQGGKHPAICPDGGTTGEDRSDIPTPPPQLTDEHISLIDEQPTGRLADWAVFCYRLAATEKHDDREEPDLRPDSIPLAYADRIRYMRTRHLRGMAAHSIALLGDGVVGFSLGAESAVQLSQVELLAKLYEWVERRHRAKRIDKDVPAHASIARKQIQSGDKEPQTYLYWQYRIDDGSNSTYICALSSLPFDEDALKEVYDDRPDRG